MAMTKGLLTIINIYVLAQRILLLREKAGLGQQGPAYYFLNDDLFVEHIKVMLLARDKVLQTAVIY